MFTNLPVRKWRCMSLVEIAIPCSPSLLHFETHLLFTQNVAIVNPCCCLDRTSRLHPHEPRNTARLLIIHWLIRRMHPSARLPLLLIVSERWASVSIEVYINPSQPPRFFSRTSSTLFPRFDKSTSSLKANHSTSSRHLSSKPRLWKPTVKTTSSHSHGYYHCLPSHFSPHPSTEGRSYRTYCRSAFHIISIIQDASHRRVYQA